MRRVSPRFDGGILHPDFLLYKPPVAGKCRAQKKPVCMCMCSDAVLVGGARIQLCFVQFV